MTDEELRRFETLDQRIAVLERSISALAQQLNTMHDLISGFERNVADLKNYVRHLDARMNSRN